MKRLLWPWRIVPCDARWVILVAFAMPFLLHLYHFAPWVADLFGLSDAHRLARIIFSASVAFGALLVGHLISRGGPRNGAISNRRRKWQIYAGHLVGVGGVTAGLMAILSLDVPWLATDDKTMTWRLLTGMSQTVLVAGWIILWRVRHLWLSHSAAGIAAAASLAGFTLYVVANFLLQDPATSSWGWGVIHPRSIVARVTGVPWLEPLIAAMMLLALTMLLRRWWRKALHRVSP